jgi:hypothetical protein
VAAPDYHVRKAIADRLFADTGCSGFEFVNQSFCKLARLSFQIEVGELPLETYGPEQLDILQRFPILPFTCLTGNAVDEGDDDNLISVDMAKCYTARLLNNMEALPVFSFGDKKQPYRRMPIGEFYIDCKLRMANGNLVHRHGWYPRVLVRYCLQKGYITHANITHVMKASRYLPANTFKAWATSLMQKFPYSYKHLLNHFVGWLGIQFFKHTEGCITDNFETAVGTSFQYEDGSVEWNKIGGQYFIQRKTSTRQYTGHAFIHRHILASNFIELDQMYRVTTNNGSIPHQIVGWNTDSMKLSIDRDLVQGVKSKGDCQPGDYYVEERCYLRGRSMHEIANEYTETEHEPQPWIDGQIGDISESRLICGMGGTGKTRQLAMEG